VLYQALVCRCGEKYKDCRSRRLKSCFAYGAGVNELEVLVEFVPVTQRSEKSFLGTVTDHDASVPLIAVHSYTS
jgi:hypothetical protein